MTKYPLYGATVTFLTLPDSAKVDHSVATESDGSFGIGLVNKDEQARFLVRINYVGMEPFEKECQGKPGNLPFLEASLDTIVMKQTPITLEEAVIVGQLKKMYTEGDTVFFNPKAFEMPDGSLLLELVRRLPGLKCDNAGNMTYKGKSIEEMRLNGTSFFRHDMTVALRNIPANRLELLKVYDVQREDSLTNPTPMTVMDMITKEPVDKVHLGNLTAAIQSKDNRHVLDGEYNYHKKDTTEISLRASSFNTAEQYTPLANDAGFLLYSNAYFPSTAKEMLRQKGELSLQQQFNKIRLRLNADYGYNKDISESSSLSAQYLPDYDLFGQSLSNQDTRSQDASVYAYLDGKLNERTEWDASVSFRHENGKSFSDSESSMAYDDRLVNSTESHSQGRNRSQDFSGSFGMTHSLSSKKLNTLSWSLKMDYNDGKNRSLQYDYTRYHEFTDSVTDYN